MLLKKAAGVLAPKDYRPYICLRKLLPKSDLPSRTAFRKLFTSYYRLNHGGVTDTFRNRYFDLLFDFNAPSSDPDPYSAILSDLYKIPRLKKDLALQAAFVSKLVSIHDESRPLLDVWVSRFFGISAPTVGSVDFRIAGLVANLEFLRQTYAEWSAYPSMQPVLATTIQTHQDLAGLSSSRVLDFLIWTVGRRKLT